MSVTKPTKQRPTLDRAKKSYIKGWKVVSRMKYYVAIGKRDLIVETVKKELKASVKNGHSDLSGEFSYFLSHYYTFTKSDKKAGAKYAEISKKYIDINHVERKYSLRFKEIWRRVSVTAVPDSDLVSDANLLCEEMKLDLKTESIQMWIDTHSLMNVIAAWNNDHDKVVLQSQKAIDYLEEKGIDRTAGFYKDMAAPLIFKGEYAKARQAINKAISSMRKDTDAWSVFVYYRIIIELHSENYQKAVYIFNEAKKKRYLRRSLSELWTLLKGYLAFLSMAGKIKEAGEFKIAKFLNDATVFTKDKSGFNVNLIILKVLLRLTSDKGRDIINEERESIRQYGQRYLEGRPRILFQMLHQIPGGNFNDKEISERVERYVEPLPFQNGFNPVMEVIPYERLWGMAMKLLKEKSLTT